MVHFGAKGLRLIEAMLAPFQPVPGTPAWRNSQAWGWGHGAVVGSLLWGKTGPLWGQGWGTAWVWSLWALSGLCTVHSPLFTPWACMSALKLFSLLSAMRPATTISEPS